MVKPEYISYTPKIPFELLSRLNLSYVEILLELSRLMTDDMLQSIASADYGFEENKCFKHLKKIVVSQKLPTRSEFILIECLELTRWSEPTNKTEHICRAFSCVLLIILERESNYNPIGEVNSTLAPLIESILNLKKSQESVQDLIVWRIVSDYEYELEYYLADEEDKDYVNEVDVNPFLGYSLLLMMVFNTKSQIDIDCVADWTIHMDKEYSSIKPFLLGRTNFNSNHNIWKCLSQKMIQSKDYITNENLNNKLDDIISCIVHEKPMKF